MGMPESTESSARRSAVENHGKRSDSSKKPLVSIVIPCFNYGHFLADAIDSALSQDYPNCGVVVVNDGSTDNSAQVAATYGDRIHYLYQENAGLSAARNVGMRVSAGVFVVFLDADDVLHDSMVRESLRIIHDEPRLVGVVGHIPGRMNSSGETSTYNSSPSSQVERFTSLDILVRNPIPATVLARRHLLLACGGFDETLLGCEDRDMWLRLVGTAAIVRFNTELSWIRRHGCNMSSHLSRQPLSKRIFFHNARNRSCLTGWRSIFWLKALSFYYYECAMMREKSDPAGTLRNLLMSVILWPIFIDYRRLLQNPLFRIRLALWAIRR